MCIQTNVQNIFQKRLDLFKYSVLYNVWDLLAMVPMVDGLLVGYFKNGRTDLDTIFSIILVTY